MKRAGAQRLGLSLLVCVAAALAVGCACPLSESVRQRAHRELDFGTVRMDIGEYTGSTVIWGGSVLECRNMEDGTELTILESPLGPACRPGDERESRGRFLARTEEFLDPEVYAKGVDVVLGGKLVGKEQREIGQTTYTYPVVEIEDIHVFPREEDLQHRMEFHGGTGWFYGGHHYRHPYW